MVPGGNIFVPSHVTSFTLFIYVYTYTHTFLCVLLNKHKLIFFYVFSIIHDILILLPPVSFSISLLGPCLIIYILYSIINCIINIFKIMIFLFLYYFHIISLFFRGKVIRPFEIVFLNFMSLEQGQSLCLMASRIFSACCTCPSGSTPHDLHTVLVLILHSL